MKNTRPNVVSTFINTDDGTMRIMCATEILRDECGVYAGDVTNLWGDQYYVHFQTKNRDEYSITKVEDEECILIYKNAKFFKELREEVDPVNRVSNIVIELPLWNVKYIELDVYDIGNPEAFTNAMPWKDNVIYTYEKNTGKFGGCIHFPPGSVADNARVIDDVFVALNVGNACLKGCSFRSFFNGEVKRIKAKDVFNV